MGTINKKVKDLYPLTSIQEGMLFHNIMDQTSGAYFVQYILKCNKPLDIFLLKQSLELLVARYDVLRTAFLYKNTKIPVQVVMKERKCDFRVIDLSEAEDVDSEVEQLRKEDLKKGFDLEKDALLRIIAINLGEDTYKLIWSIHHIIIDGWSNTIIFSTFSDYYNRLAAGILKEQILEEISETLSKETSFGEYVKWIKKKDIHFAREYFKDFLKDYENVAIFDHTLQGQDISQKHHMIRYKAINTLLEKLNIVAHTYEVTLNTITETAVGLLIQKYCHLNDVVFGKVVSGREVPINNIDRMVGIFINTIPQRIKTVPDMTILDLLKIVQAQSNESSQYDYLGLSEINALSPMASDLIKVLFVYENYYVEETEHTEEAYKFDFEYDREQTNYDITLSAYEENEDDFYLEISYNESLYDERYAMGILKKLEFILLQITEHITQKVCEIPLASTEEAHMIMNDFNKTAYNYDATKSVVDLFEAQVEATPHNVAVVCNDQKLTYEDLNKRANRIAHGLRSRGIGLNDLVAVITDKSCDMVVMLLGVIKAGAAYIPLDIAYPEERINYILEDAKPKSILVHNVETKFPLYPTIDFNELMVSTLDDFNPQKVNTPDSLLYIIYTSGTTGKPKGVMLEHKGIINLSTYFHLSMKVQETDKVLQFAKYTFDGSVWEMTMALLSGARLVICTEEERLDQDKFMTLVTKEAVSIAALPPAFYNTLHGFKPRILITAGSEAIRECIEKCIADGVQYINSYGPTECSVAATEWKCKNIEDIPNKIPIGKPICNTRAYIVTNNKLCGIGLPGEICLQGNGLAKGYMNNPTLTAKHFIKNPFGEGLLYRTGDLGRWLEDGNIDYMGRIDKQVKVRGFRIELAEIEEVLRKIDDVEDCAVIVRKDHTNENYICAFITSHNAAIKVETLKVSLSKILPDYMLPSYIVKIDKIPFTANGKLDVKSLPHVDLIKDAQYIPPHTELEKLIAKAFEEILDLKQISITQSFFEIGGHSLRATRLVNNIESKTGIRIPVKAIFERKTIQSIASYIADLKEPTNTQKIEPALKKDYYLMSSVQKSLYLIEQLDETHTVYNMPQCFELSGTINETQLTYAYQKLVDRHEALRTIFEEKDGEFIQRIKTHVSVKLCTININERLIGEAYQAFITPFDLSVPPLIRLQLVRTNHSNYLFLDMHHLISDGMSMFIVMEELVKLYNGENLQALEIQYKDYSEWFRKRDLSKQKEYWVSQFKDNLPVLNMPLDYTRPNKQSFKGSAITKRLGKHLTNKVKALAKSTHTTEYMVVLSGLMITLSKYCYQSDIAVGTVISGRTNKELENIIGMFVNTLVIRADVEKEISYETFLAQLKTSLLNAYENQEYPFEDLVNEVCHERDISRNPLFDVMFAFQNNELFKSKMDQVSLTSRNDFNCTTAKFDLTFNIDIVDDEYELYLEYCTDLFKKDTIIRLYEHFKEILESIVLAPTNKLGQLQMLTSSEEDLIKGNFNATDCITFKNKTVVELFEEQVKVHPHKDAVVFEKEVLSYRELNEKANAIAHKLHSLGIQNNECVAILAQKGVLMIVGILGIIKSGAAYVPIDASYPKERIDYLLHDCNAKALLTYQTEYNVPKLPMVNLEDEQIYGVPQENPIVLNTANDLIYIIYTSGTTGLPKGVMVEHKSVVRLVKEPGYVPLNESTIILQTGQMSFDASTFEVWGALLNGGTLHLMTQDKLVDHTALEELIKNNKINTLWLTSTLFNQMFATNNSMFDSVDYLLIGGEKLSETHVKAFKTYNHHTTLINGYGPTENTTFTTTYTIPKDVTIIPIGKPIHNTKVYVMTDNNLCGIDVPGELCITGEGLARGYLNHEELTQEKFITNPFGEGLLYKSGDLVRWREDGNIEYLGRIDKQVKIRGFRIEPAEVEVVLRKLPDIKDCAVIVREDQTHEKALYAYICSDNQLDLSNVKSSLKDVLPQYMIPTYMMQIEALPMTRNGKLNERALPVITVAIDREYIAPSNAVEKNICDIYTEILGIDKISIEDDFFALGGHSLRATRLVNRIEAMTGVRLSLKDIFALKTPSALANCIMKKSTHDYEPIPLASQQVAYPMSSTQKRIYLIQQMDENSVAYNMPECYELKDNVNILDLKNALSEMIKRHEILRTRLFVRDGQMLQQVLDTVETDFIYEETIQDIETVANEFIQLFALNEGKVLRMKVIKNNTGIFLLIDMHHIASDGMSAGLFMKEFSALYAHQELVPLTLQYKDYSEWMRSRDLQGQENYWLNEFKEEAPILELPYDYRRGASQSFKGAVIESELSSDLVSLIRKTCLETGTTDFILMLSALMVTLAKYSNQEDIVIGTTISGRTHKDTEQMLGMFVNTLAMRGKPEAAKTIRGFLEEMKAFCMKSYENQEYPFEELVEKVVINRDRSRNPLFDVMFSLQNNEEAELTLGDTAISQITIGQVISKFDLSFDAYLSNNKYTVSAEYCTELFKAETVKQILAHYSFILQQMCEHLESKLSDLELVTPNERKLIVDTFNSTVVDFPNELTLSQLFEQRVQENPESIAVIFEEHTLTYRQLNEKANQVAHKLRKAHVGPNDFVAIIAERSLEMIIGIYGIIKSGAAYVPMDPAYPEERLTYMLQDCAPKVLVTYIQEKHADQYGEALKAITYIQKAHSNLKAIDLYQDDDTDSKQTTNPECISAPNDLAYVIYTSGTTGKPKGVMIEQHSLINLIFAYKKLYSMTSQDVLLQFASFSFDQSVWEIFSMIMLGGSLCLMPDKMYQEKERFFKYLEDNKVTIAGFTPAFIAEYSPADFKTLRLLESGGAEIKQDVIEKWLNKVDVVNTYGPTENTVNATTYHCNQGIHNIRIPIGKPCGNVQAYIISGDKLCGVGMLGELCVAGEGIARGYLNRPKLTEEKFVKNPFGPGKMYKTGDLAKWLSDGNIDYMGRIDEQIKIRGFRIELGEIESVIRNISIIKDCAVIAHEDLSGDMTIYAYLVADTPIDIEEIRQELKKPLPAYMIPTYMIQIDAIPVTTNGKLDKHKLNSFKVIDTKQYIAPQNKEELVICEAYRSILNLEKISTLDTFFELGGDSIKAIRVVSKLREHGYNAKVREILNNQNIVQLAKSLSPVEEVVCEQDEITGEITNTPIMQYFDSLNLVRPEHFNQSMTLEIEKLDKDALHEALTKVIKHHDMLRAIKSQGGMLIRSSDENSLYDYYEYTISSLSATNQEAYISYRSSLIQGSINLSEGPLVKVILYKAGEKAYVQMIIHHLVVDGVSFRIIIEDFETAYVAATHGKDISLPQKTQSYKSWGDQLKTYTQSKEILKDKLYWDQVSMDLAKCHIPKQLNGPIHYKNCKIEWSEEITAKLLTEFIPQNNVTINDVLITALGTAIYRLTDASKIAVEMEGHGRENLVSTMMIDRTVGWFTSVFPVILESHGEIAENLEQTKNILNKIPSHGATYNILKYLTASHYDDSGIDIAFNYLGSFNENNDRSETIGLSTMSVGTTVYEGNHFARSIDLNGLIENNHLIFDLQYDTGKYTETFIQQLARAYKEALEELLNLDIDQTILENKQELPVVLQDEVKVYLHRSLPLCIILAYENYKEWYYSNYIQIFSKEDEDGLAELNYLEPRDSYMDISDVICLGYHMFKATDDFIEFVKDKISLGYYIIANVDEMELSNKFAYQQDHYIHSSLIYGYDDTQQILKGIGFDESSIFTYLDFDYDELQRAFINGKKYYNIGAPWCAWSAIQLIKPKTPDKKFLFDQRKFLRDLHDYIYAVPDTYRLYTFAYAQDDKVAYGINTYDVVIERLKERVKTSNFTIDYRAIHLIYEHKQGLYQRIDYMINKYELSDSIKETNENLKAFIEEINEVRLKWFPIDYNDEALKPSDYPILQELIKDLTLLKEKEQPLMMTLYEKLTQELKG